MSQLNQTRSEIIKENQSETPPYYSPDGDKQVLTMTDVDNHSLPILPEACEIRETPLDTLHKQVTISSDIHYTNITAFTTIDNRPNTTIHLYHVVNDTRIEVDFVGVDLDNDTLVNRIEWTVPHLSEETYEIIIEITHAEHLDEEGVFLSDISETVNTIDGSWSESIPEGHCVRVTFEKALENINDITSSRKAWWQPRQRA